MRCFRVVVDRKQAARLGRRRGLGPGAEPGLALIYRPAWLIRYRVTFRRFLGPPRVTHNTVFVDAVSGKAEECMVDAQLLVENEPGDAPALGVKVALGAAQEAAHRVILDMSMKRNHTFWLPDFAPQEGMLIHCPHWVAERGPRGRISINAVTGQVGHEE